VLRRNDTGSLFRIRRAPVRLARKNGHDATDATVEPKCIGKGRIRCVYFRTVYSLEFQAAELAPLGVTAIAASTGHAESGRSQGERISAGAV